MKDANHTTHWVLLFHILMSDNKLHS